MIALSFSTRAEWPPLAPPPTTLARCLILAALLHALLVAIFGNTPGGTARPGEGVWGPLNITLRGVPERGAVTEVVRDIPSGPPGNAPEQRFGGAVRDDHEAPRTNDGPGAARLGTWRSTASERATDVSSGGAAPAVPAPPAALSAGPAEPADMAPLARSGPGTLRVPGAAVPLAKAPVAAPDSGTLSASGRDTPSITERVAPVTVESRPSDTPRAAPAESEARLKMVQSPPQVSAPPVAARAPEAASDEAARASTSETRTLTLPAGRAAMPEPVPRLAVPRVEPIAMPRVSDTPVVATPRIEPPVEIKAMSAPATPAPSVAREVVPRTEPVAMPVLADVPAAPRGELAPALAAKAPASPTATPAPALVAPGAAATAPAMTPAAAGSGAPEAGPRVGHDVATAPSAPASAPRLNLELTRPRGGEISREASRGVLQLVPHPPERKSKLAEGIEKSTKKDCRTAYAGFGLLAVVPLVVDATKSSSSDSCRW